MRKLRKEAGFTIIEVMIALLILLIGLSGILSMQMTSMGATAFSRHATEASVVGEKKMEELTALATTSLPTVAGNDSDLVDSRGESDPGCYPSCNYTREWTAALNAAGTEWDMTVKVTWYERGTEPYSLTFYSRRGN
jgi:prepilin-type N-terminal cleavage/methylation domain-containing protein